MEKLTEVEWQILDKLSDGHECVATMGFPKALLLKVRKAVYDLYRRGLILAEGQTVEYKKLMNEPEEYEEDYDGYYWFELTESGAKYWEEGASVFSDGPIDWSKSWTSHLSYENQEGYIDGTSREVCLSAIQGPINKGWEIDMDTITHSEIEGFKAKYYKYLPDGHRITFKLKKKTTR